VTVFVVEVVLGVIAVLAVALLLAAVGAGLPPARPDSDDPALPTDRLLTSQDVATLRFRTAVRGYRMEDVDAAMAAVHAALWVAESKTATATAATTAATSDTRSEPDQDDEAAE
jgi:DivIVA domain-containing protein